MPPQKIYCDTCDEFIDNFIENKTRITHKIRDEEITLDMILPFCPKCGEQLCDVETDEIHYNYALNEYRKRKGLLSPEEIKSIRESYGLSQRAFSRALGLGEPTINRYELGALQDTAYNSLLLLVREPQNMLAVASSNRGHISEKEYETILSKVKKLEKKKTKENQNDLIISLIDKVDILKIELVEKIERLNQKFDDHIDNDYPIIKYKEDPEWNLADYKKSAHREPYGIRKYIGGGVNYGN